MAAQKLLALAAPRRYAVRDLFDLHHLLLTLSVAPEAVAAEVSAEAVTRATAKIRDFTHRDFAQQVLPYLPDTLAAHYRTPYAFDQLTEAVTAALARLGP